MISKLLQGYRPGTILDLQDADYKVINLINFLPSHKKA